MGDRTNEPCQASARSKGAGIDPVGHLWCVALSPPPRRAKNELRCARASCLIGDARPNSWRAVLPRQSYGIHTCRLQGPHESRFGRTLVRPNLGRFRHGRVGGRPRQGSNLWFRWRNQISATCLPRLRHRACGPLSWRAASAAKTRRGTYNPNRDFCKPLQYQRNVIADSLV